VTCKGWDFRGFVRALRKYGTYMLQLGPLPDVGPREAALARRPPPEDLLKRLARWLRTV